MIQTLLKGLLVALGGAAASFGAALSQPGATLESAAFVALAAGATTLGAFLAKSPLTPAQ